MLTNLDLTELTEFRRELHRHPELSGEEVETASKITAALRSMYLKSEAVGQGVSEEYRLRVWPFAGSFALDRHSISFDHIRCFFCDHNGWCIRISGD